MTLRLLKFFTDVSAAAGKRYLGKKGPAPRGASGKVASTALRYCLVVQNKGNASEGMSLSDE